MHDQLTMFCFIKSSDFPTALPTALPAAFPAIVLVMEKVLEVVVQAALLKTALTKFPPSSTVNRKIIRIRQRRIRTSKWIR